MRNRRATTRRWSACSCSVAMTVTTQLIPLDGVRLWPIRVGAARRRRVSICRKRRCCRSQPANTRNAVRICIPALPRTAVAVQPRQDGYPRQRRYARLSRPRKTQYSARHCGRSSLYSHSDQQAQWQSSISDTVSGTGWGGRVADQVACVQRTLRFPGGHLARRHGAVHDRNIDDRRLAIPASGSFALAGYGAQRRRATPASPRVQAAPRPGLVQQSSSTHTNAIATQALHLSHDRESRSSPAPIRPSRRSSRRSMTNTAESAVPGRQDDRGAAPQRAPGARSSSSNSAASTPTATRLNRQQNLFAELSPALKAFYDATTARWALASQVTTFTLSDFGRTLQPASGGGYRPRLGQSPFHYGRCGQGRVVLRAVSDAATRRTERRGAAGALDSDYLSRSVWSDSCEMVRCRPQRYQHGFRQPCSVRFIGPRFSHTEPALNPSNPGKIVSPHPKVSDPRSAAHGS